MGFIEKIFERIDYPEVNEHFEKLESLLTSINQGIELALNGDESEEAFFALIKSNVDTWDDYIERSPIVDEYYYEVSRISDFILSGFYQRNLDYYEISWEKISSLMKWFRGIRRPCCYAQLLYYHQQLRQLRTLLLMYQSDGTILERTHKHLFEMGLQLLRVDEIEYLNAVYDENAIKGYSSTIGFITTRKMGSMPMIYWISDPVEQIAVSDNLYRFLKYAERAYRKQNVNGKIVESLEPYRVHFHHYEGLNVEGRFLLNGNMNGYLGYSDMEKAIIVGFSGTEFSSFMNWKTNICQFFGVLDPVYVQAAGLVRAVWLGKSHKKGFKDSKVIVCGHSLGGGLMQFAVSLINREDVIGYEYNSAGLSEQNVKKTNALLQECHSNVFHLYQPNDKVFTMPGCYQLGRSVNCPISVTNICDSHRISTMRKSTGKYIHDYVDV